MQTYVYEDTEVKLTGRVAIRKVNKNNTGRRRELHSINETKLVEVETVATVMASQKMWVSQDDLFIVHDPSEDELTPGE